MFLHLSILLCGLLQFELYLPRFRGKTLSCQGLRILPFPLSPFAIPHKGQALRKEMCNKGKSPFSHVVQQADNLKKKKIRTGRRKPPSVMNVLKLESAVQVVYFLRILICPPWSISWRFLWEISKHGKSFRLEG